MRRVRGVALLLVAAFASVGLSACGKGSYKLTATFDDVGDLQSRGSVQTADVRIGHIDKIKLTDDYKAKVTLAVTNGVKIPKNAAAVLRTTSLLGEKFVELRPNGRPTEGPFFHDGDTVKSTIEAPELEFVANELVTVLGSVNTSDLASMIETGAIGFGGRGPELKGLIGDLSTISSTLASRTNQLGSIIDNLDHATQTLSGGTEDVKTLLTNLSTTSQVLVDNRQRLFDALSNLSRLARVQNEVLDKYHADIDRQIKQIDAILATAAGQVGEVGRLVDFLDRFIYALPKSIPSEFTQVYMWLVPCSQDEPDKVKAGCPSQ